MPVTRPTWRKSSRRCSNVRPGLDKGQDVPAVGRRPWPGRLVGLCLGLCPRLYFFSRRRVETGPPGRRHRRAGCGSVEWRSLAGAARAAGSCHCSLPQRLCSSAPFYWRGEPWRPVYRGRGRARLCADPRRARGRYLVGARWADELAEYGVCPTNYGRSGLDDGNLGQ